MDKQIGIPTGMLVASAKRLIYFESHQIKTKKHEMKIDGHLLFDQVQKIKIIPKKFPDGYKFTILHHIRGIDGKTFKVTKIYMHDERSDLISRKIDTNMTQEELKQFQTDWTRLWRPKINENWVTWLQFKIKYFNFIFYSIVRNKLSSIIITLRKNFRIFI